ncbi:uncharacterized protein si:ch211-67f13.7 [Xyrichtys novacula]|uniref:Uncharacterized protein si:ch211-67f13.7 n=1 Tax=Xyrichtys novacula TaxID=13765 RepID=A0AAV1GM05_XYRNO|nr:uncharacterized protein si:ch211-67f13.7 [Xyrichtys novacula]
MELMDDSWTRPSKVQVYQLGKTVNFQVSGPNLPTKGKVYISSCYATPSTGSESLKYTIIDNFGCMIDSKRDPGASQFISRTDKTLRFSLKAFQFTSDPDTEVSIHCKLLVTSEDPSAAQKSCTYRVNRWEALTGDDSICECCDSQCVTSKPKRAMIEGTVSSGSLLVSDQPSTTEDDVLSARTSSVSRSRDGLAIISHYIDELHSYEDLLEKVDVVNYDEDGHVYLYEEEEEDSEVISEETAESDLDESGFRENVLVERKEEPEVSDANLFEDEGSGHLEGEVVSEREEEEEREDGISDGQKEAEVLRQQVELEKMLPLQANLQTELQQPPVSENEDDNSKQSGGDEEDIGTIAAEVEWKRDDDDKEQIWYFSWR